MALFLREIQLVGRIFEAFGVKETFSLIDKPFYVL
jgi:hypothetical protein